jgi:large conductance mechanosensitive channel
MPLIGGLLKMVDLTKLSYTIPSIAGAPGVVVPYGKFLQVTFDFVIIAAVVFLMISLINKALKKPLKEEKKIPEDIVLLTEIRDALAGKPMVKADVVVNPEKTEKMEKPAKKAVAKKKTGKK